MFEGQDKCMILEEKEAIERLNSPLNLINRISQHKIDSNPTFNGRRRAMSIFIPPTTNSIIDKITEKTTEKITVKIPTISSNPFAPRPALIPQQQQTEVSTKTNISLPDVVENGDSQIQLATAHDSALQLVNSTIRTISAKLPEIKPDRLPSVMIAAGRIVESIRRERSEAMKAGRDREVHFHFYTPQQKVIEDYEVIDVNSQPLTANSG